MGESNAIKPLHRWANEWKSPLPVQGREGWKQQSFRLAVPELVHDKHQRVLVHRQLVQLPPAEGVAPDVVDGDVLQRADAVPVGGLVQVGGRQPAIPAPF